jgi:hypothetical protein
MHITVGEVDMERFQKQQEENVLLKKRVYHRLDVDLSAPLPPDVMEESLRTMRQRKLDDFMSSGLGRVGAQNAVEKWLLTRNPSRARRFVYLWYEKKPSTWSPPPWQHGGVCRLGSACMLPAPPIPDLVELLRLVYVESPGGGGRGNGNA